MGLRGRPPKATDKHRRQGTFRKDRHAARADVIAPIGGAGVAPPFPIDAEAQWLWKLVADHLPAGTLGPIDAATLAGLCRWWSLWRKCDSQIESLNQDDPLSMALAYKLTCMSAAAWKQFEKLAARFGMTPSDRARLKAPKQEERNPFLEFLNNPSRQ